LVATKTETLSGADTPRPSFENLDDRTVVWSALSRLPARQRAAIVLRYYEDFSEAQTAAVLDCPVGTVKSMVHRGLAQLREFLGESEEITANEGETR
jgi:RNA polymerase sigma factor (sigma-70 family)